MIINRFKIMTVKFLLIFSNKIIFLIYWLLIRLLGHHNPIKKFNYDGVIQDSKQGSAALKKLEKILITRPKLIKSVADIGANSGFYSLEIAKTGAYVYAFEPDRVLLVTAYLAAQLEKVENISFSALKIVPENVDVVPKSDCTLFMSVMHYWVEDYGWDRSLEALSALWSKTSNVMYFEIPNPVQNTKLAKVLNKMGTTDEECQLFIENFLHKLEKSNVELLGYFSTDFRPNEKRHLYKVTRLVQ